MTEELILETEKMAFEGRAIARPNRFVIFVDGALPGEKIRAVVTHRKRHHAFARMLEVIEPSPQRVSAPCPVFGECGGCSFQHMAYPAQLAMKRDVLIESLHGVAGVPDNIRETIGADSPFYFRNKMVFAFGLLDDEPVLGLHRKGDWRHVVPADACLLQSKGSNEIVRRVMAFMKQNHIDVFNDERRTGLIRHLVIREGKRTNERMVHLHAVSAHSAFDSLPPVLGELCDTFLVSVHYNVPEAALPEQTFTLKGSGKITEHLDRFQFEIGPTTFFQTNTIQAEKLFGVVHSWAAEIKPKNVVDLYAGTGPIGMFLSNAAEKVVCIESNADSVFMAQRNIELNGLKNIQVVLGETEKSGPDIFPKPTDLIVVDPPRPGLHKKAMQLLLNISPPHLIYVSCNPATLARDLKQLVTSGYAIEAIQPVDMFPHSFHIEAIAKCVHL